MTSAARAPHGVNAAWHHAHPMPAKATFEQRVAWHRAHSLACACRPMPADIRAAVEANAQRPGQEVQR